MMGKGLKKIVFFRTLPQEDYLVMNYPAASSGVSIAISIIAPSGGELNLYPHAKGG
jgi:hypothetical protein